LSHRGTGVGDNIVYAYVGAVLALGKYLDEHDLATVGAQVLGAKGANERGQLIAEVTRSDESGEGWYCGRS